MNFSYLENYPDFSSLYDSCRECESFVYTHANISVTAARKAMELLVKLLYGTIVTPEISGLSVFNIISDYDFVEYIGDSELMSAIHEIRKKGNQAVHEGNMTQQDAMGILEKLHFVTGELCVRLKMIDSYPSFDPQIEHLQVAEAKAGSGTGVSEIDESLIFRVRDLFRSRMKKPTSPDAKKAIINVHIDPRNESKKLSQRKITKGTDLGANGKTAYQCLAGFISEAVSDAQVLMERVKSELVCIRGKKETVIVVKTGCTNLGTKNQDGEWELLPGVDYVLYAPDVVPETPIETQFRLLKREEFLKFWEDLGLLRYKVSTAMYKKIAEKLGPDAKVSTEEYADVISIQSFTNSGKKHALVLQGIEKYPRLSEVDFCELL